jgi:hypothetical protein
MLLLRKIRDIPHVTVPAKSERDIGIGIAIAVGVAVAFVPRADANLELNH